MRLTQGIVESSLRAEFGFLFDGVPPGLSFFVQHRFPASFSGGRHDPLRPRSARKIPNENLAVERPAREPLASSIILECNRLHSVPMSLQCEKFLPICHLFH